MFSRKLEQLQPRDKKNQKMIRKSKKKNSNAFDCSSEKCVSQFL